jgi:hypothetical protein
MTGSVNPAADARRRGSDLNAHREAFLASARTAQFSKTASRAAEVLSDRRGPASKAAA